MPDTDLDFTLVPDPDEDDNGNPRMVQLKRSDIRRLEHGAKEAQRQAKEMKERLDLLERERAFVLAGINTEDPRAKYFVKGYDGELTTDAIKAAAIEAQIVQSGTPNSPEEIAGHQAAQSAMAGGIPPNQSPNIEAKLAEFAKARFSPSQDEANQAHIQEIAKFARENGLRIPLT